MAKEITDVNFEEIVSSGSPVVVDFWAPWCGPCKMLAPQLEAVSEEMPEVKILKVNVDSFHELASEYGVSAIPTMYLLINGEEAGKNIGFLPNKIQSEGRIPLTEREFEVLKHLVTGKSNTEIAKELIVSVHTAKAHVCSILQKMCVNDRVQAAVKAVKEGIV